MKKQEKNHGATVTFAKGQRRVVFFTHWSYNTKVRRTCSEGELFLRIRTEKIAYFGLLTAMAIVLGYIERTIPILDGSIPGVKLGLSNVIILFGIYIMGGKSAFMLMLLKVFLLSLMFTGLFSTTMMVSLGGGFLSYVVMTVLSKLPGVTVVSVSVMGAVAHNVGQTLTSCVILGTYQLLYTYLPAILISAVVTGVLTGLVAQRVIVALKRTGVVKHIKKDKIRA
jgi:heptaprenyl diphosphate synthase